MASIDYKNHEIWAVPRKFLDRNEWEAEILVVGRVEGEKATRHFASGSLFADREEAIRHCFEFGKHMVDGGIGTASPADS